MVYKWQSYKIEHDIPNCNYYTVYTHFISCFFLQAIQFHPNSNYIATGSTDRTVRLWDISNGNCVRVMTGHKVTIPSRLTLTVLK